MHYGSKLIEKERERQVGEEGWTPLHDHAHAGGELASAAACYAAGEPIRALRAVPVECGCSGPDCEHGGVIAEDQWIDPWPWMSSYDKRRRHTRLRQVIIAGALIAAELDRLTGTVGEGVRLISSERQRQVEEEGWDPAHDRVHDQGELATAAACYAACEPILALRALPVVCGCQEEECEHAGMTQGDRWVDPWPWNEDWDKRKKHGQEKQLVIAGALLAAEIDRLLYEAEEIVELKKSLENQEVRDVE